MASTSYDTVWPADSVEFCPHPEAVDIFACGTYKLEQQDPEVQTDEENQPARRTPQTRRGKCLLFQVDFNRDEQPSLVHETSLPAVLDMKWCHRASSVPPLLGITDSEGNVSLHSYEFETKHLNLVQNIPCASSDILVLSLDWDNRRFPAGDLGSLVVSLSNGSLSILRQDDSHELVVTDTWHAHDYEPWIAAWNYWDPNVLYSGGDDLKLRGWDVRAGFLQSTFTNKRFDAGVTTIQSHPFIEHLVAVGSYDNTVRLFDMRSPLKPLVQADVGGGAWRVKWHPSPERKHDLLVACMHDGCKILNFSLEDENDSGLVVRSHAVTKRFDKHESMAYGADWSFAPSKGKTVIGSCSFYDHLLQLWQG
ncbi:hypothetical protein NM688_g5008 [Phlebia brevispora]|uniref:Uncharacterized protein n=1 Tax=Phlebia brevispora TaxID=194682 RepID=A0ACC1T1G7_9APHY|nr:hypothetical protein NM688_g5008 [Phlebia brevispora]